MDVFRGHRRFIFQSKPEDHKNTIEIFDLNMRLVASCSHKHSWKIPDGPFKINKQARATDIILESYDGRFLGDINEVPPELFSMRAIRKFEIYDDKKELVGRVKERPKFVGTGWELENSNAKKIAMMVGNRKNKNYKIQSPSGQVLAKCGKDSSFDNDSYRIDVFVSGIDLFLVLCYVIVLDLAKTVWMTRETTVGSNILTKYIKPKTALRMGGSLIITGFLVWIVGYIINYTPYVSFENGLTYFDAVAAFGYLPIFFGFIILFFLYLPRRNE